MKDFPLSRSGRSMLNRRDFLRLGGTGLSSIALLSLLAEQKMLAATKEPIRPQWSPANPYAPRQPHFTPAAKNVVVIFCAGACSQLETWDYKPELFKRDGQPMPGAEKIVTFQGENGNLTRPLWDFKPRGQSGKMISEMLPHLAGMADEMCFIHSMTAKSNTGSRSFSMSRTTRLYSSWHETKRGTFIARATYSASVIRQAGKFELPM